MEANNLNKKREEDDPEEIDISKIFNFEYNFGEHNSERYFKEHFKNMEYVAQIFRTDLQKGLCTSNQADLNWRKQKWGNNNFPPEIGNSILAYILNCFEDKVIKILLFASIVSLIVGVFKDGFKTGWIEGAAILLSLLLEILIKSYINVKETEQFQKLKRELNHSSVLAIRDGVQKIISIEDILVGDILKLSIGDIVHVDGFLFGDGKVGMDESPVNGDSDIMWKVNNFEIKDKKYYCPFIFSGSQVVDGQGYMVVAAVGDNTFQKSYGEIKEEADDNDNNDDDLSPIKKQLNDLSGIICSLGYILVFLIFIVTLFKEGKHLILNGISSFSLKDIDFLVNSFIIAILILIVTIPEGLLMSVTIAFAFSVGKMKREHNLIQHLDKAESLGNVNNICVNKTGVITLGLKRVRSIFIEDEDINLNQTKIQDEKLRDLIWSCIFNNITCTEVYDERGKKVLKGDTTEEALYQYLKENDYPLEGDRKSEYSLPFKSEYMMNICKEEDEYMLYVKGTPEQVIPFFESYRVKGGDEENFEEHYDDLIKKLDKYKEFSLSPLIFGYKKLTKEEVAKARQKYPDDDNLSFFPFLVHGLCFAFMVGIYDQNRIDVPEAIRKCDQAGIKVRMVTGDDINTAIGTSADAHLIERNQSNECKNIASYYKNLVAKDPIKASRGITTGECPMALEGGIFSIICGGITLNTGKDNQNKITLKNKEAFKHTVKRLKIIARASREDKLLLVLGLKELGNIVAVSGNKSDDVQALKQAHVGFGLGIRGTQISNDSADVILLDDSFSSVVTAIKYGRNIYSFIGKFIQFQFTIIFVTLSMTFIGSIILKDFPLSAIQMLWVNLILDSFASVALATEDPTDDLLNSKPFSRDESIITPMIKNNIIYQSIFQIIVLTGILLFGDYLFGVPSDRNLAHFEWNNNNGYHLTIFFNIFVFLQVFNLINSRKIQKNEFNILSGILRNRVYLLIQGIIIAGQVILITFGGKVVRTHPLSLRQHCLCLLISSTSLVWCFLVKLIPINSPKKIEEKKEEEEKIEEKIEEPVKKVLGLGHRERGKFKMSSGPGSLSSGLKEKTN